MNADEETGKVRLRAWRIAFALEQVLDLSRSILFPDLSAFFCVICGQECSPISPFSEQRGRS